VVRREEIYWGGRHDSSCNSLSIRGTFLSPGEKNRGPFVAYQSWGAEAATLEIGKEEDVKHIDETCRDRKKQRRGRVTRLPVLIIASKARKRTNTKRKGGCNQIG